ncbi:hypothetical protein BT93_L5158 [Corymbia citriodora subsp. variegata]|uniref:Uncharacterized protein n=1 Tax=Corymbia citriodora subsp. variegata TaxID=360336 RepID=A0A8T0CGA4_CORYI|nr:hypothetical protein BT93_L5158 [Corymbia citriodora subsp. variegata]
MTGAREEVLSQYDMDLSNVPLQIVTNLTHGPVMAPNGARISNYSTVEQIYTNTSASTAGRNVTTVKLFCNFCADNRTTGMEAVLMSLNTNLETLATELNGGNITYPGPNRNPSANMTTSSMNSTMSTASRSMTSMLSSTSAALSSAASTSSA